MSEASATIHINAPADRVFALVTDLTRIGELSPETTHVVFKGNATSVGAGARWTGHNAAGDSKWKTDAKVSKYDAPNVFTFDVHVGPVKVSRWSYEVVADLKNSCTLTEKWTDRRNALVRTIGDKRLGGVTRADHNAASIKATLERIKAVAEAEFTPPKTEAPAPATKKALAKKTGAKKTVAKKAPAAKKAAPAAKKAAPAAKKTVAKKTTPAKKAPAAKKA